MACNRHADRIFRLFEKDYCTKDLFAFGFSLQFGIYCILKGEFITAITLYSLLDILNDTSEYLAIL